MFCWHVFGNISGGFRGISRFLGNFAGFRRNTWISRVRDRAKYQTPWNVDIDPYLRHVKLYADLFKICCKIIPFFLVLQSHTHQLVTLKWISVSYVQEQVFPLCRWFLVLIVHQHPVSFHRTAHQWASRIRKMVGRCMIFKGVDSVNSL